MGIQHKSLKIQGDFLHILIVILESYCSILIDRILSNEYMQSMNYFARILGRKIYPSNMPDFLYGDGNIDGYFTLYSPYRLTTYNLIIFKSKKNVSCEMYVIERFICW